jgi:hypothetical protein
MGKFILSFSYTYIFSTSLSILSQKSHHMAQELDSMDKLILGHHEGITGTHLDQQLTPQWTTYHKDFTHQLQVTKPNYNPQYITTP